MTGQNPSVDIVYTDSYIDACRLRDQGYEPIECAFGGYGSVLGPLAMDHHGTESHRPGVAIRACGEFFGQRKEDPRFVVTGTPDADAILAIVALSAMVEQEDISESFCTLVDRYDRDPIGIDLTVEPSGTLLLAFNQTQLPRGREGFERGLTKMVELLTRGLPTDQLRNVLGMEKSRQGQARKALVLLIYPDGTQIPGEMADAPVKPGEMPERRVALVKGSVWGFDLWYRWAPVVVSWSSRLRKITVGCPNLSVATECFGPGGLMAIYPKLGIGWGGRETVGGSPRGVAVTLEDARHTAVELAGWLSISPPDPYLVQNAGTFESADGIVGG